ncbi:MAG: cysteine-rich CWC family protein [Bacteroidota bacterium]
MNNATKVCPLCKTTFICNPAECWCSNLPEELPMLESGDCYCPKCLQEMVDKNSGTPM